MRVFVISDLHIDYKENHRWVQRLSNCDFTDDVVIVAGDVTDRADPMRDTLCELKQKFARVFFVPGNHDLWVRPNERCDSLEKFHALMALCNVLDIETSWAQLPGVQIVPLLSWYEKPEESTDSLYVPQEGEDAALHMWADNRLIRWTEGERPIARYMLAQNTASVQGDGPVITFSHFLPRRELIFGRSHSAPRPRPLTSASNFNFSRVAGTRALDRLLRKLGSSIHIYGHQHRNRRREIEGVTYISHCLGYQRERQLGVVCGMDEGPRLVWET